VRAPATKVKSKRVQRAQQASKLRESSKRIAKKGDKSKRSSGRDHEFEESETETESEEASERESEEVSETESEEASETDSEISDQQQQRGRSKSPMKQQNKNSLRSQKFPKEVMMIPVLFQIMKNPKLL